MDKKRGMHPDEWPLFLVDDNLNHWMEWGKKGKPGEDGIVAWQLPMSVIIYEEVSNAYGPVYDAHRCDPVGTVFPDSGDSVVVDIDNGWIETIVCTLDGDVIDVGNYSWGSWVITEGATFTLSSVIESHVVRFTFAENYGQS